MIDSVENLAIIWASIDRLCSDLPAGQWDLPTGCPGWTVKDQVSHMVDYEARALGRPARWHEPVKSDILVRRRRRHRLATTSLSNAHSQRRLSAMKMAWHILRRCSRDGPP